MTAPTPLQPAEHAAGLRPDERPTAALEPPSDQPILDSLPLLDHRTRGRAISRRLAPRGHYIAVQDGDEERLVELASNITHVGRGLGSDIRFDERRVSRNHAIIARQGRHARVLDNRSSNGTFVNGRRIVATDISDGDVVRLGPVTMQYIEIS